MSKNLKALMAAENAAGFAMAPPRDEVPVAAVRHLEAEFRDGHKTAAQKAGGKKTGTEVAIRPGGRTSSESEPLLTWLQTTLAHIRPGGVAA